MKLVIREPDSAEAARLLAGSDGRATPITSAIAQVEVLRAAGRYAVSVGDSEVGRHALQSAEALLSRVQFVVLDPRIVDRAGRLPPPGLRSLDALHLASALALSDLVEAMVVFDERLHAAARAAGLTVRPDRVDAARR